MQAQGGRRLDESRRVVKVDSKFNKHYRQECGFKYSSGGREGREWTLGKQVQGFGDTEVHETKCGE